MLLTAARLPAQAGHCRGHTIGPMASLIDAQRRPIYIESSSIVRTGRDITMFGTQVLPWRSEHVFVDTVGMMAEYKAGKYVLPDTIAGVILHPNGESETFGRSKGVRKVEAIAAVPDGLNGAWVAWVPPNPDPNHSPQELWAAHYRNKRWDSVQKVAQLRIVQATALSMAAADSGRTPIIATSGTDTVNGSPHTFAVVYRWNGRTWDAHHLITDSLWPLSVGIAAQDWHRLVVAFLGDDHVIADSNAVFASVSSDGGRSWTPHRPIDVNWNKRANWIHIHADTSRFHISWMSDRQGDDTTKLIHIISPDGVHWRREHQSELPALSSLATALTRQGLAYIIREAETSSIALVDLRSNAVPALQYFPVQGHTLPQRAATLGANADSVFVTWGQMVEHAYAQFPGIAAPRTHYAWVVPCAH